MPVPQSGDNGIVWDLSSDFGGLNTQHAGPVTGTPVTVSSSGDTTLVTPAAGGRIRLRWVGLSTPEANTAEVLVKVLLGATEVFRWNMGKPSAFAHTTLREGAIDAVLKVNLSVADQPVYVNFEVEVV